MLWRRLPSPSITPNELLEILTAHTAGYYVLPLEPNDEVFPGIFIGDSTTALCLHLLKRLGITHVLNAAWGKQRNLGMVNTSATYYHNAGIEFMGIEALDIAVFPLFEHFHVAANFIERALNAGGKVLVHCGEGISRSSTLVLAYLMIKRGFHVQEAVRQVVKYRNILPNQGFLLQLCQLHDQLSINGSSSSSSSKASTLSSSSIPSSPSPSTVRSSISPLPEYVPSTNMKRINDCERSSPIVRRCQTPPPSRTSWSNGWMPSTNKSYVQSPSSLTTTRSTQYSGYWSPQSRSIRNGRSSSVDRESPSMGGATIRHSFTNTRNGRLYNNTLMSSYLSSSSSSSSTPNSRPISAWRR